MVNNFKTFYSLSFRAVVEENEMKNFMYMISSLGLHSNYTVFIYVHLQIKNEILGAVTFNIYPQDFKLLLMVVKVVLVPFLSEFSFSTNSLSSEHNKVFSKLNGNKGFKFRCMLRGRAHYR